MPRALIATAPREPLLVEYDDGALNATGIRIRTEFASPKHGTELVGYRNSPAASRVYDPRLGAVLAGDPDLNLHRFPRPLGNMAVGRVIDVGAEVTRFRVGDRVFGHFSIRETQTVDETAADLLPEGLSDEAAVCLDPVVMALAMRDAGIQLGDRVAVFGLGAIGLFAVQLARLAGASHVIAVDPIEKRRALALAVGADAVLDPTEGDTGKTIREMTGDMPGGPLIRSETRVVGGYFDRPSQVSELGVDVAVETSGSVAGLQQAIRATRFGGTVCVLSFYGSDAAGLYLGDEFHVNRVTLISARAESLPMRGAPGWTLDRLVRLGLDWLANGRLQVDGVVTPVVAFEDSAEAYREIDEHPERSIKLGIRFD